MMQLIYNWIPEKIRLCFDAVAFCAAIFSLPVVEVISGITAALASSAAFVYTVIRTYYYLKEKRKQ